MDTLARRVADALYPKDKAAQWLGITVVEVGPGTATLAMTVRPEMLNGHAICHGGMIFTLADTAFAYACNSRNAPTVAQHCLVNFLRPGKLGDRLTARAAEVDLSGRSGLYDVTVTDSGGETVAEFRGMSRAIAGTILPEG